MDDVTMEHDAIGWFYMVYGTETQGGPVNLKDFIPALNNPQWAGSNDGVLFKLVSGSGFYTFINGTYTAGQSVGDAFQEAVTTYAIPNNSTTSAITTLFGLWD